MMVVATSVDKWLLPALVKLATNLPAVTNVAERFYMTLHCTHDVTHMLAMRINVSSPAVKGQNCSFFDKSIKLGRVANLYKTNIS